MKPTPGSSEWHNAVKAQIRKRHSLRADQPVGLKVVPATVTTDEDDPHTFTAQITKNIADRDDEAVLPGGMMADEFDVSGSIFWNHNYDMPVAIPSGKLAKSADAVTAKAQFLKRPSDFNGDFFPDFARAFVNQMSQAQKKPGVSIGFIPVDTRKPTSKDKEDYGEQIKNVVTRWKLLEWSVAPVQANPGAYVTAVGKAIGPAACKALFGVETLEKSKTTVFLEIPLLNGRPIGGKTKRRKRLTTPELVNLRISRMRGWPLFL